MQPSKTHRSTTAIFMFVMTLARVSASQVAQVGPNETAAAREQFQSGLDAARRGDWVAARRAFERSYAILPRPLTLLNLAGAQAQTGQAVAAGESYRRFLREATSGPAADQREAAQRALDALAPRIARLQIRVPEMVDGDVVQLDGRALLVAVLDTPMPVDPGQHAVVLMRRGAEFARTEVQVSEGQTRDVVVRVTHAAATPTSLPPAQTPTADTRAAANPPAPAALGNAAPTPTDASTRSTVDPVGASATTADRGATPRGSSAFVPLGGVAAGVAAVSLGFGFAGLVAREGAIASYNTDYDRGLCPGEDVANTGTCADRVSTARTWSAVSTSALIGGAVFGAGSLALFVVGGVQRPAAAGTRAWNCMPALPTGVLCGGRF